jgi:hypothetical protein
MPAVGQAALDVEVPAAAVAVETPRRDLGLEAVDAAVEVRDAAGVLLG